jgi:hypothetical protein
MTTYYTMAELAKVAETRMAKAVYLNLLRQSKLLKVLPIKMTDAIKITANRWQAIPDGGTRAMNGVYTPSIGLLEPSAETLYIYGGEFTIDRIATKVATKENPLLTQTKMKTAGVAARFNFDFFRNDHTVDANGFIGLYARIANQPVRCTINIASGTAELPVLASAANEHTFIDAIHEALHKIGVTYGDDPREVNCALFMNESTLLGIGKVMRRLGLLDTTKDAYDRRWSTFGPAKLIDVGLRADQSTEIISLTEDPGDGGNDSTSIIAVRFGGNPVKTADGVEVVEDDGVRLLQLEGTDIAAYDPLKGGEQGAGLVPGYLRRIDCVWGIEQVGSYGAVRVKGFEMAAS